MTREIRYPDGNRARTPKYIDHGHTGRKIVYWTAAVLVAPLALIGAVALFVSEFLENVFARRMSRLRVWSHPCLYAPRPKLTAPELSDEWKSK